MNIFFIIIFSFFLIRVIKIINDGIFTIMTQYSDTSTLYKDHIFIWELNLFINFIILTLFLYFFYCGNIFF